MGDNKKKTIKIISIVRRGWNTSRIDEEENEMEERENSIWSKIRKDIGGKHFRFSPTFLFRERCENTLNLIIEVSIKGHEKGKT